MRDKCYRFWPVLNYAELPAYLEQMEQDGLRFEKLSVVPFLAVYSRIGRRRGRNTIEAASDGCSAEEECGFETRSYCWDSFRDESPAAIQDYLDTCEATGWEIAWQFGRNKLFRSMEGKRNPAPIQEPEAYRTMLMKESVRPSLLVEAMLLLFIWCMVSWMSADTYKSFAALFIYTQLFVLLGHALIIGLCLWFAWNAVSGLMMAGKLRRGEAPVQSGVCFSLRRRRLTDLITAAYIAATLTIIVLLFLSFIKEMRVEFYWVFFISILFSWNREGRTPLRLPWGEEADEDILKRMKGVYRRPLGNKTGFLIWAAVFVLLCGGIIVTVNRLEGQPLKSRNLYCSSVYTDVRGNTVSNMYFEANDKAAADKVLRAALHRRYLDADETDPILPDEAYRLDGLLMDDDVRERLSQVQWDECYDGGLIYLVVRRQNEIWCIVKYDGKEDKNKKTIAFLEDTGF